MKFSYFLIIVLAVLAISVADVCLKKAGTLGNFSQALKSPWFIAAALLYLFQVVVFLYVFIAGADLSYIGIVQTVLYSIIVIGSGILLFHEQLTLMQGIGAAVAVVGVILLNL